MENTTISFYQVVIAGAREAARDTLRTRNIHKWIREIKSLEMAKKDLTAALDDTKALVGVAERVLKAAKYDLSKLDTAHPDHEAKAEKGQKAVDHAQTQLDNATAKLNEATASTEKQLAQYDKEIAECNAKIGRWEDGTNKVQMDNLNDLSRQYVEEYMTRHATELIESRFRS